MKRIISLILALSLLAAVFIQGETAALAKEPYYSTTYDYYDIYYNYWSTYEPIYVNLDRAGVIRIKYQIILDDECLGHSYHNRLNGKHGIEYILKTYDATNPFFGYPYDDWYDTYRYLDEDELYDFSDSGICKVKKGALKGDFSYCTKEVLPAGLYSLHLRSLEETYLDGEMKCKITIYTYSGFTTSASFPKSASVNRDSTKTISLKNLAPSNSIAAAKWSISNSKIAKITKRDANNVTIKGVKNGSCTLTATLKNGTTYNCKVTVKQPAPKISATKASIPYSGSKTLKINYTGKKAKWSSSNKKVAVVNSKGKVTAKGLGNCTITAKIGKKKYTCKVKVYRKKPDLVAAIDYYATRDNYFAIKYKNYGDSTVTILPNNAKALNRDYKSYDRKLYIKSGNSVKIKPGQTKTVKFKVKGSNTWPYSEDFTVQYYFKYNGGKYLAKVWHINSLYKAGGKWRKTYKYYCDEERIYDFDATGEDDDF